MNEAPYADPRPTEQPSRRPIRRRRTPRPMNIETVQRWVASVDRAVLTPQSLDYAAVTTRDIELVRRISATETLGVLLHHLGEGDTQRNESHECLRSRWIFSR